MNVLIACEESQRICIEFRKLGHKAFSCDIQPCSGGHPEWHYKGDVFDIINGECLFVAEDNDYCYYIDKWDLIIAHPPCTDLAVSGAAWFKQKQADGRQQRSIDFFMKFTQLSCPHVAIENPVCIMSTKYRKPDQIIQPYMFGDHARKKTCLWLKGLPLLEPTNIVDPGEIMGNGYSVGASLNYARDEKGKILAWNDPRTAKERSKTFPGIAKAIAEQWSEYIERSGE